MSLLTKFIEDRLQEKRQQRWVIHSNDLFDLFMKMGIMEEEELLMDILEYLEEQKIDVHFENSLYEHQLKFKKIEQGYKIRRQMKGKIEENKEFINKIINIKPSKINDDFLYEYMTDDEEVIQELKKQQPAFNKSLQDLQEDITKNINQQILENAPPIDTSLIEFLRNNP